MAASKQNIKAGGAYIEIAEKGISAVQKKLDALGKSLTSMGDKMKNGGTKLMGWSGAALGSMAVAVKAFAETGATLDDMSKRTGVAGDQLSLLSYAAEQSGTSIETLETVLKKTNKAVAEALKNPTGEQADLLKSMGLDPATMMAMKPEERLMALSDAMATLSDQQREFASVKLFKGLEALPLLSEGSKAIKDMMQQGADKGFGWSNEDLQMAAELDDAFVDLKKSVMGIVMSIGNALAPMVKGLIEWFVPVAKAVADWVKNNKELIVSVAKITAIIFGIGAALFAIGTAFVVAGGFISGFAVVIGAIGAVITTLIGIFGFFLTPIGLIVGGLALLAGWIAKISIEMGDAAIKTRGFAEVWNSLKDTFNKVWGGIKDAFAAGDLQLAMEIAWAGLKLAWATGIGYLKEKWAAFKLGFQLSLYEAWHYISVGLVNIWTGMKGSIVDITYFLENAWHNAATAVQKIWKDMIYKVLQWEVDFKEKVGILSKEEAATQRSILAADLATAKTTLDLLLKGKGGIEDKAKKKYEKDLKDLENEKKDWTKTLDDMTKEDEDRAKTASEKDLEGLKKDEEDAKKKLDELTAKAKAAAEAKKEAEGKKKEGEAPPPPPGPGAVPEAVIKGGSSGLFNVQGARGLAGFGGMERQQVITNRHLKQIEAAVKKEKRDKRDAEVKQLEDMWNALHFI